MPVGARRTDKLVSRRTYKVAEFTTRWRTEFFAKVSGPDELWRASAVAALHRTVAAPGIGPRACEATCPGACGRSEDRDSLSACPGCDADRDRPAGPHLERPRDAPGRRRSDRAGTGRSRRTDLGLGRGQHPPLADRAALRPVPRPARRRTSRPGAGRCSTTPFTPSSSSAPAAVAARCTRSAPTS